MKNFIFLTINILVYYTSFSQTSSCNWAQSVGASTNLFSHALEIDNSNKILKIGYFQGTADFDPSPSVVNNLTSTNGNVYIQKLNEDGSLVWVMQIGYITENAANFNINVDEDNNIVISGQGCNYSTDFDPSTNVFTLNSQGSYVAKYSSNGNFIWAKNINCLIDGGTVENGSIYLTGSFLNTVDFDPNSGVNNLISSGATDAFVLKLSNLGDFVWVKQIMGALDSEGYSIDVDQNGNVYTSGGFSGAIDLDPSTSNVNVSGNTYNVDYNVYFLKLDVNGNYVWSKSWTSPNLQNYASIDTKKLIFDNNKLYVCGYINGTIAHQFTDGQSANINNGGGFMVYSLDASNGSLLWKKSFGGNTGDYVQGMDLYNSELYLTGFYDWSTDLDLTSSAGLHTSNGVSDAFLLKVSNLGNYIYSKSFGGSQSDYSIDVKGGINNSVYMTGIFRTTVNFELEVTPPNELTAISSFDGFTMRYHLFPATISETPVTCFGGADGNAIVTTGNVGNYTYEWSNGQQNNPLSNVNAGIYDVLVTDAFGCQINLSTVIDEPSQIYLNMNLSGSHCSGACDGMASVTALGGVGPYSYQWGQNTGSQTQELATDLCPDMYTVHVTDANGCIKADSIEVFYLESTYDYQVYLTNLASVDLNSVSPDFDAFYQYNLPQQIISNSSNPRNFVDPGKHARFKVECTNQKMNGQSIVSGFCKVRTNNPYVTITDSISALNNVGWNGVAWSADEFEMYIDPNTPAGTNVLIDFFVEDNMDSYATTCISIPIHPLVYSPTTMLTIDDDNNPDSQGNNNDICEPGETIEFYPWLDNISTLDAEYVRGRFENLDNHGFINIWNGVAGVGTTVYDATWWNYSFAQPQTINPSSTNTTPEYDFVFDYNSSSTVSDFDLYMVMAGGFNLFNSNALSLVQWSLPYTFNSTGGPVSIEENGKLTDQLLIYPNPASNSLSLISKDGVIDRIVVRDLSGKICIDKNSLGNELSIDVVNLSNGTYILECNQNGKSTVKKLIIVH